MKNKVGVSYYPGTSKRMKSFWKSADISGICEVNENELTFTSKMLGFVRIKDKDFTLLLKDIEEIELVTLNLIMSFGLCITMKNGQEYMLGSLKRAKLMGLIEDAIYRLN